MSLKAGFSAARLDAPVACGDIAQTVKRKPDRKFCHCVITVPACVGNSDSSLSAGIRVHMVDPDKGHGNKLQIRVCPDHFPRKGMICNHENICVFRTGLHFLNIRRKTVIGSEFMSVLCQQISQFF